MEDEATETMFEKVSGSANMPGGGVLTIVLPRHNTEKRFLHSESHNSFVNLSVGLRASGTSCVGGSIACRAAIKDSSTAKSFSETLYPGELLHAFGMDPAESGETKNQCPECRLVEFR